MKTSVSSRQTISTAQFVSIISAATRCYVSSLYAHVRTYIHEFDWRVKYRHMLEMLDGGDGDILDISPAKFVLINIVVGLAAIAISFLG